MARLIVTGAKKRSWKKESGEQVWRGEVYCVKARAGVASDGLVGVEVKAYESHIQVAEKLQGLLRENRGPVICECDVEEEGRGQYVRVVIVDAQPVAPLSKFQLTHEGLVDRPVAAPAAAVK